MPRIAVELIIRLGWDTLQFIFAWMILCSFAFSSIEEARIPLAVIGGAQLFIAIVAVLILRFGFRKNSAVCTSVLYGTADPVIACFVVLMFAFNKLPGVLSASNGYTGNGEDGDTKRIVHFILVILPASLRFIQNKGRMTWRSFIFINVYSLVCGIEIITMFMMVTENKTFLATVYPAIYLPTVFILISCLYVVMYPLYIDNSNPVDKDQHGRRYRHLVVLFGVFFVDVVQLGLHANMARIGIESNVVAIFFYFFLFKNAFMIIVVAISIVVILCLKYVDLTYSALGDRKEAIRQFYFGKRHRVQVARTHAEAVAAEEMKALATRGKYAMVHREESIAAEARKNEGDLDEKWQPQEEQDLI